MAEAFVEMLRGDRNNLGRTEEVVAVALNQPNRIDELYQCFFQPDEWVRLRTASSFKRIWRANVELFLPYLGRFVRDVSKIDQPSVQWTFAELCVDLDGHMTGMQRRSATSRVKKYLTSCDDWIVLNRSMQALANWSANDPKLAGWLVPELERLAGDDRSSVASRATKLITQLATVEG